MIILIATTENKAIRDVSPFFVSCPSPSGSSDIRTLQGRAGRGRLRAGELSGNRHGLYANRESIETEGLVPRAAHVELDCRFSRQIAE